MVRKLAVAKGGELHPHRRMSIREKGRPFSRAVPKEDYEWIEDMTNKYREFRRLRTEIRKLEQEIRELINEYENQMVNKTRKGKAYLEFLNN